MKVLSKTVNTDTVQEDQFDLRHIKYGLPIPLFSQIEKNLFLCSGFKARSGEELENKFPKRVTLVRWIDCAYIKD